MIDMSDETHDAMRHAAAREYNELSRRQFIAARAGGDRDRGVLPGLAPEGRARRVATTRTRDVIVSIFLRGGADGLSLCVPFGDRELLRAPSDDRDPAPRQHGRRRKGIALDNFFALPAGDGGAACPRTRRGNLLVVHATGSIDHVALALRRAAVHGGRQAARSDASSPAGSAGTCASVPPVRHEAPLRALGSPSGLPKTLVGAPEDAADRRSDELRASAGTRDTHGARDLAQQRLRDRARAARVAALDAVEHDRRCCGTINFTGYVPANGAVYPNTAFGRALRSTAALIKADIGIEAAQVDIGGWDTHAQQDPLTGIDVRQHAGPPNALGAFHADVIAGTRPRASRSS